MAHLATESMSSAADDGGSSCVANACAVVFADSVQWARHVRPAVLRSIPLQGRYHTALSALVCSVRCCPSRLAHRISFTFTCSPVVLAPIFSSQVLLFRPCSLVFVESFCRVESVSLSGRMLYPVVDEFVVQWPQLAASAAAIDAQRADGAMSPTAESQSKGWKYVKYIGRLC